MHQGGTVQGQPHGVEAVVHVHHTAGDGGGQGGEQEGRHVAHLLGFELLLDGGVGVRIPGEAGGLGAQAPAVLSRF